MAIGAAIKACGRCAEWQAALKLFGSLQRLRMQENVPLGAPKGVMWALRITYSSAMSACSAGDEWQRALELFEKAVASGEVNLIVLNAGISACERGSAASALFEAFENVC